jgi:hypothetical protein
MAKLLNWKLFKKKEMSGSVCLVYSVRKNPFFRMVFCSEYLMVHKVQIESDIKKTRYKRNYADFR